MIAYQPLVVWWNFVEPIWIQSIQLSTFTPSDIRQVSIIPFLVQRSKVNQNQTKSHSLWKWFTKSTITIYKTFPIVFVALFSFRWAQDSTFFSIRGLFVSFSNENHRSCQPFATMHNKYRLTKIATPKYSTNIVKSTQWLYVESPAAVLTARSVWSCRKQQNTFRQKIYVAKTSTMMIFRSIFSVSWLFFSYHTYIGVCHYSQEMFNRIRNNESAFGEWTFLDCGENPTEWLGQQIRTWTKDIKWQKERER